MRARAEQCDVLGFAETHLRGEKLEKMKVDMSKDGWKAIAAPSTPTGRSQSGTTGGEAILCNKTLATTSCEGWRKAELERSAKDPFGGFCPSTWHTKSEKEIVVAAYLQPKF
eukprot:2367975-Pyramimonas_sp.AAC.1